MRGLLSAVSVHRVRVFVWRHVPVRGTGDREMNHAQGEWWLIDGLSASRDGIKIALPNQPPSILQPDAIRVVRVPNVDDGWKAYLALRGDSMRIIASQADEIISLRGQLFDLKQGKAP